VKHFSDTSRHGSEADDQVISLEICPSSSDYDITRTINFNYVIDEFASIKARKVTL
jgi:hypothetical protein